MTIVTFGLFWFVYLHQVLRPRLAERGEAFPTILFWASLVPYLVGQALLFLAVQGAGALTLAGLGLVALAEVLAIAFFVLVIRRGELSPWTWVMPALSAYGLLEMLLGQLEATRPIAMWSQEWLWIPGGLLFLFAWYRMHRGIVADVDQAAAPEPAPSSVG